MPKQTSNPSGTVTVNLFELKKQLAKQAKAAGTTGTNLARILIRDGLARLESGEVRVAVAGIESQEVAS
jgi:hypothetical protein